MQMHKVKMLSTRMGVHDGQLHPVPFIEGETYEIGPDLLDGFISLGAVELVDSEIKPRKLAEGEMLEEGELPERAATQVKSEDGAPENKAFTAAPENKKKKR